eukprot:TRINITY_DN51191_c0_g1_i1.p2 TRINITY_DN51191_c0_g1~~TRINITY_DN51191_c0_g1_i1.p2  ORF type:complete len:234 (+),score=59.73 TRINITY_DN51191_c0_g1_i1:460-1161(+)
MKYFFILLGITSILFTGCVQQPASPDINKTETKQINEKEKIEKIKEKIEKEKKEIEVEEEKVEEEKPEPKIPEPKVIIKEKTKIVVVEKPVTGGSKIVAGSEEHVYIPSVDLTLKARIDTGATTTSLHALDIKEFERDGKKWVKFKLETPKGKLIDKSLPVEREVNIKRHGAAVQKRYVIKLRINLGSTSELIDVSLTDRSNFSFPVLIGRNYLNGYVVVDVSKKYVTKPKKK